MTTQPTNESELQLYRVLQRANLLAYYDTFICQGGDDVQQLCEAGEEEFLEIMALVGMASKPLHVRRLQKALQEWITNPSLFQSPVSAPFSAASQPVSPQCPVTSANTSSSSSNLRSSTLASSQSSLPMIHNSPNNCGLVQSTFTGNLSTPSPNHFQNAANHPNEYSQPCSPVSMTPVLVENQIQRLAEAAELLVKNLPPMDFKPLLNGNKKRISKEIENIMTMSEDDPRRMEEIRKYAAIYGRFDCKRKPEKPLTLHEVSVNEAAAQICSKIPCLLYRRDELFPLARQVVRDSGYQYSKGHSRSQSCSRLFEEHHNNSNEQAPSSKRMRLETSPNHDSKTSTNEEDRKRRHNRLEGIVDQLKSLGNKQEEIKSQIEEANERQNFQEITQLQSELDMIADHHMQLVNEKTELEKQQKQGDQKPNNGSAKLDSDKADTEDTDSQFSLYSNESTPSILQESQQNSPNSEIIANSSVVTATTVDIYAKTQTSKRKQREALNQQSSNDSIDFSKQIINEAIDEGLRVAKELGQVFDENIDLRLFNKYTEALRNSGCFGNLTLNESNSNTRTTKQEGSRTRGRPPKTTSTERDIQSNFYEQILSQAQIQQQMQIYQTHLQQSLQAQAVLFGELNLSNNASLADGCEFSNGDVAHDKTSLISQNSYGHLNDINKTLNETNNSKDSENIAEKDEMVQSLNALISMNNNNNNTMIHNENIKNELSMPSVDFKIA